jgi:dihydrofolate reductase
VGTVIMHNVVSLEGFIADGNDDVGPRHDWYFGGDTPITGGVDDGYDHSGTGAGFKVSRASADYVRSMWDSIGTIVMGRHLFDLVNGWEGRPPTGDHVVVVSHRPKPEGWHPEASYHFVDDIATGVARARELSGDKTKDSGCSTSAPWPRGSASSRASAPPASPACGSTSPRSTRRGCSTRMPTSTSVPTSRAEAEPSGSRPGLAPD